MAILYHGTTGGWDKGLGGGLFLTDDPAEAARTLRYVHGGKADTGHVLAFEYSPVRTHTFDYHGETYEPWMEDEWRKALARPRIDAVHVTGLRLYEGSPESDTYLLRDHRGLVLHAIYDASDYIDLDRSEAGESEALAGLVTEWLNTPTNQLRDTRPKAQTDTRTYAERSRDDFESLMRRIRERKNPAQITASLKPDPQTTVRLMPDDPRREKQSQPRAGRVPKATTARPKAKPKRDNGPSPYPSGYRPRKRK